MAATMRQVREAMQAALQTIGGVGYTLDLTGMDAVKIGRYIQPWGPLPAANIFLAREEPSRGPELRGTERTMTLGGVVWFASTASDPETIEDYAETYYEDIRKAFRPSATRHLGGLAIETSIALDGVLGPEEAHLAGAHALLLGITIRYREIST